MAKENIEKKVAAYFKQNQSRGVVYTTSDGFLFERKENANTHAKTQKDYNVETFTKSVEAKAEIVKETKGSKESTGSKKTAKKPVTKAKVKAPVEKVVERAAPKKETAKTTAPKNPATTGSDQVTAK